MITSASQAIVEWLVREQDLDEEDVEAFWAALYEGVRCEDIEALEVYKGLMYEAETLPDDHPMKPYVALLFRLHRELISVITEERKVEILSEVRRIVDNTPNGTFARRVATRKIVDMVQND